MNISSDCVIIDTGDNSINLPRNSVENLLGKKLVELHKKIGFQNVLVLNGPGGFTNLRVGTLCLNVLNTVLKNQLFFYDISKIDLYKKGFELGYLQKYGVIYIGQKRNIRLRDFEKNEKIGQYSFDELKGLDEIKNIENVFAETVGEKSYYPEWMDEYKKIDITFDGDNLSIDGKMIFISDLNLSKITSIAPNYMMEPSITISNK